MVNKIISRSSSFLLKRQNTILSAALIMMVLTLASNLLGAGRNWFLARYFGAGGNLDAFNTAFVIPDLIVNVLVTGALSAAFIPTFTGFLVKKRYDEGEIVASTVLNLVLLIFGFIGVLIFIFPQEVNHLFGIHLAAPYDKKAAELMRIIIFGELLLIIGSFLTSVLQSYQRFLAAALAPIAHNLGIIFGIVVLSRSFGILGVGLGVVIGAVCHVTIQLIALNHLGFNYRQVMRLGHPDVRKILKLSLPRAIGVGVGQLEVVVNFILASSLAVGSIAIMGFASDLQVLPIGLFGVTLATAALPTLSMEWAAGKKEEFKKTFLTCLFQLLYLAVPVSVILAILRVPIVRLVYGSGLFDWAATLTTATTVSYFAIGVFAQAGFLLVTKAFYAIHDTVTPLKVAVAGLAVHIAIGTFFIFGLAGRLETPVAYLGLTTSLSGIFSFVVLFFLLDRNLGHFGLKQIVYPLVKIVVASLVMAIFVYVPLHLHLPNGQFVIDYIIDTKRVVNLLFLTMLTIFSGLALYTLVTWWLKSEELQAFLKFLPDIRKLNRFLRFEESITTPNPNTPHRP